MVIYKFYLRDVFKGDLFLGSLPERRKNSARINQESILNWGRKYVGMKVKAEYIFFIIEVSEENEKRSPASLQI